MPRCDFCGLEVPRGKLKIFVYTNGKIANFCSRKCEKNLLQLKRKPLETRWTEAYRKEHKKGSYGSEKDVAEKQKISGTEMKGVKK